MKCTIQADPYYFGTKRWCLNVEFGRKNKTYKSFFLGQDVKFCSRVLGMTGREVMEEIGVKSMTTQKDYTKLANFIVRSLELTPKILKELQPWELACE